MAKNSQLARDVAGFAAVELGLDLPAERRVVEVAQDVARLDQPAERGERLGDAVVGARGGQALQHDMGRGSAGLERGGDAHELVPLLDNEGGSTVPANRRPSGPYRHRAQPESAWSGQILEARHEVDAQQGAEAPQGLGEAVGVRGVKAGIVRRVSFSSRPSST